MNGSAIQLASTRRGGAEGALGLLTAANAALYLAASVLHLGVTIPLGFVTVGFPEPSPPASMAEALIGAVLAAAGAALFAAGPPARRWAWGAHGFALIGTLVGLTIVLLTRMGGANPWVHVVMLVGLTGGLAMLSGARRIRGDGT